jgi:cell division control protein 6
MSIDISIFDYPEEASIILRDDVLSPDYIPARLIGRDEQIKQVAYLMKPLFRHGSPNNALIFGPAGCGKTVVTKYVLKSLMVKLNQAPVGVNVDWVYIHCKKVYTSSSVLYTLIHHLDPETKIPKTGYSLNYYYDALFGLMNNSNKALIVILDEIDFLKSDDVLYNFSRAVANEELKDRRFISVIGLSNSLKYEEKLDPRVLSSMGFEKLRFPPYYADPIFHILNDRINIAFTPNSISEETLMECSIDSARANGDVRKALKVLSTAASLAENEGVHEIKISHIKAAEEKVQTSEIIESVMELPLHHKIILSSIIKANETTEAAPTGDVVKMYNALCKRIDIKPVDPTMVSKNIGALEMQSFIQFVKVNRGRKGGVTRLISINPLDLEQIKIGIYDDDLLDDLKNYYPIIS